MVIDPLVEQLIPLPAAVDVFAELGLPPVGYESLRRWRSRGAAGVILESTKHGGRYFTTREAVHRFATAVAEGAR